MKAFIAFFIVTAAMPASAQAPDQAIDGSWQAIDELVTQRLDHFETIESWTDEDREAALQVVDVQGRAAAYCILEARGVFQDANEPVDTIVTAIVARCNSPIAQFRRAAAYAYEGLLEPAQKTAMADEIAREFVSNTRSSLTEYLVGYRMRN